MPPDPKKTAPAPGTGNVDSQPRTPHGGAVPKTTAQLAKGPPPGPLVNQNKIRPRSAPANGAQPIAPAAPANDSTRLTPQTESRYDFGEHVIGSHPEPFRAQVPYNLTDKVATARFSVSGDGFQLTNPPMSEMTLLPSAQMSSDDMVKNAPEATFEPTTPGVHDGTLTIAVEWPMEGITQTQTIALHARARELTQAPSHELTAAEKAHDAAEAKQYAQQKADDEKAIAADDKKPEIHNHKFDGAADSQSSKAAMFVDNLADKQSLGIGTIESEATKYKKIPPKEDPNIWLDIGLSTRFSGWIRATGTPVRV